MSNKADKKKKKNYHGIKNYAFTKKSSQAKNLPNTEKMGDQ